MKKLLIATAVFITCVCTNAASYNWSAANDVFSPDGENVLEGTVYFFDATAYALGTITSGLSSTGTGVLENALKSGALSDGAFGFSGSGITDDGESTPYAHAYVIVISTDEKNYWASDVVDVQITNAIVGGGEAVFSFGEQMSATWQGSVAPEPTSGLLMLFGMGLLALKRKRV